MGGWAAGTASLRGLAYDCRLGIAPDLPLVVEGRFEGWAHHGPAPFRVESGLPGGCRTTVRTVLRDGVEAPLPGTPVRVTGRWRGREEPDPRRPEGSGTLSGIAVEPLPPGRLPPAPVLRLRGRTQARIASLYGERAPVVDALVLARREGIAPELRESFALSGTAHLLAISGFHVGVVAGLLFTLFRRSGISRGRAAALAAGAAWGYVLAIGAPWAAARAALLVSAVAVSRLRRRPVHPLGALASAALLLTLVEPSAPRAIGFQLSFAGAAGLLLLWRPLDGVLRRWGGDHLPAPLRDAVVAGVAATLATTPLAAWHFHRIPLLGIPATLVVGPLVALSLPGILASLALATILPGAAAFLAGGVSLLLGWVEGVADAVARIPGAAPWVDRPSLVAAGAGGLAGAVVLGRVGVAALRPAFRIGVVAASVLAGLLLRPVVGVLAGRGELVVAVLDVGQGDAVTLRTPGGRWVVVDAGPRSPGWDAGARVVLPHLRRQGARRVELLVLTHPHLDHVGGAEALLRGMEVGRVADPGHPAARAFYTGLLGLAVEDRVGWWPLRAGEGVTIDGVEFRVLHPIPGTDTLAPVHGANTFSVVLEVRHGAFRALLTGDAPEEVERVLAGGGALGRVQLLKVGHHGSRTSTGWDLLEAAAPEVAVIPVGRGNPFGHPHDRVLFRLERAGVRVLRTDRHGTVTLRARKDGRYRVSAARGRAPPPPPPPDFRDPAAPGPPWGGGGSGPPGRGGAPRGYVPCSRGPPGRRGAAYPSKGSPPPSAGSAWITAQPSPGPP